MNDRERATVMVNLAQLDRLGYPVATWCVSKEGAATASIKLSGGGKKPIKVDAKSLIEATYTAISIAEARG